VVGQAPGPIERPGPKCREELVHARSADA
jgi:hypothetical protein